MRAICRGTRTLRAYSADGRPEALLRIGRAIQSLEGDHADFFSPVFSIDPAVFEPDVRLVITDHRPIVGISGYTRAIGCLRRILGGYWRARYGQVGVEVRRKWQRSEHDLSMQWEVVAPSPRPMPEAWLLRHWPTVHRGVYGGERGAPRAPLALLSGYSHYRFSCDGLVQEHCIDGLVPPPGTGALRTLRLLVKQLRGRPALPALTSKPMR